MVLADYAFATTKKKNGRYYVHVLYGNGASYRYLQPSYQDACDCANYCVELSYFRQGATIAIWHKDAILQEWVGQDVYQPKRGSWKGLQFDSRYDYTKFKRNPTEHRLWDQLPQLWKYGRQYDSLYRVPQEVSMRAGSELRAHLDAALAEAARHGGGWYQDTYVAKDGHTSVRWKVDWGDVEAGDRIENFFVWLEIMSPGDDWESG